MTTLKTGAGAPPASVSMSCGGAIVHREHRHSRARVFTCASPRCNRRRRFACLAAGRRVLPTVDMDSAPLPGSRPAVPRLRMRDVLCIIAIVAFGLGLRLRYYSGLGL